MNVLSDSPAGRWRERHRSGGLPPRRNPLCRRSDRIQWMMGWICLSLAVIALPVVTAVILMNASRIGWADRPVRSVKATVVRTQDSSPQFGTPFGGVIASTPHVKAHWRAPDGTKMSGMVTAPSHAHVGDTVRIWTTSDGQQAPDPASARRGHDLMIGVLLTGALFAVPTAAYGAYRGFVRGLDRRRLREWDVELGDMPQRL